MTLHCNDGGTKYPSAATEIRYHKVTAIRWKNCIHVPPTTGDKQ